MCLQTLVEAAAMAVVILVVALPGRGVEIQPVAIAGLALILRLQSIGST